MNSSYVKAKYIVRNLQNKGFDHYRCDHIAMATISKWLTTANCSKDNSQIRMPQKTKLGRIVVN